jgi:hypothetical protein
MPIIENFDELYIVDDLGHRLVSTSGFEGGRQSNFNNYNLVQRIDFVEGEAADLTARFPPLSAAVSTISFYSPSLNGWQSEWWRKDIPVRAASVTPETDATSTAGEPDAPTSETTTE